MSSPNPYAPPTAIAEPEPPSVGTWQIDGTDLLVKNGVALPKIDLNTGEQSDDMKCIRRTFVKSGALAGIIRIVILIAVYQYSARYFHLKPYMVFLCVFVLLFLWKQSQALRASPAQRLSIWEFVGSRTLRGSMARNKWRVRLSLFGSLVVFFAILQSGRISTNPEMLFGGLALLMAAMIWRLLDTPAAKSRPGRPGWMRISPIHPDAFTFLSRLQNESRQTDPLSEPRRRLVRTTYFYRFPLAILTNRHKHPLALFNIVVAKLLRSHQLKRTTYHFSEAEVRPLEHLCKPLQGQIGLWNSTHPGWTLITATHLAFPDGDVTVETAHLSSPSLEHHLTIVCSWNVGSPDKRPLQFEFNTWLADGTTIVTHGDPFLRLGIPERQQHQAKGTRDQVFQAHLENCAGRAIDSPQNVPELLTRLHAYREETDRRLTDLGYQSETREVA